jgi:hypothetical protein
LLGTLTSQQYIVARSTRHLRPLDATFLPTRRDIFARSTQHFRPLDAAPSSRGQSVRDTPAELGRG